MADVDTSFLPEGFQATPSLADLAQDDSISFRERLTKHWGASQFVRVVNVDNEPFTWQELPLSSEFVHQPDRYVYNVYRKKPDVYTLQPGEQKVIEGGSAYIMVKALYDKLIQKRAKASAKKGELGRLSGPAIAEEYISRIVVGVEDLASLANRPTEVVSPGDDVYNDLGLVDEPAQPARRGRPPKTA